MEIGLWASLVSTGPDALPLKQRIPEVAVFRRGKLEACFYSDARGLLRQRSAEETTRDRVLNRLLASASPAGGAASTDIDACVPLAILRRTGTPNACGAHGLGKEECEPEALLLSASEVIHILGQAEGLGNGGLLDKAEMWSLQSLVLPAVNMRIVAVYSRSQTGEERLDLIGRSFSSMYHIGESEPSLPLPPGCNEGSTEVPLSAGDPHLASLRAKVLYIVRYMQQFHGQIAENLIAEFVLDGNNRVILHGFWKASLLAQADKQTGWRSERDCLGCSLELRSHATSTTVPGGSCMASVDFATASVCVSAAASRPTSAVGATPSEHVPHAWRSGYAAASRPASASSRTARELMEAQDLQIPEDDEDLDDGVEEHIERLQASAQTLPRRGGRPMRSVRPQRPPIPKRPRPQRPASAPPRRCHGPVRVAAGRRSSARFARPPPSQPGPEQPSPAPVGPLPTSPVQEQPKKQHQQQQPSARAQQSEVASARPHAAPQPPVPRRVRQARQRQSSSSGCRRTRSLPANRAVVRTPPTQRIGAPSPGPSRPEHGHLNAEPEETVYSGQVLSRHQLERDVHTRLLATLTRQLERYRDKLPVYKEQVGAARLIAERALAEKQRFDMQVCALKEERRSIEVDGPVRRNALIDGLADEERKTQELCRETKRELDAALEDEQILAEQVCKEEGRSMALQSTLNQTLAELHSMQTSWASFFNRDFVSSDNPLEPYVLAKNLLYAEETATAALEDRRQVQAESEASSAYLAEAEEELARQRAFTGRLEEFVRRIADTGSSHYPVDPAVRREAAAMLKFAARTRTAGT